MTYWKILSMIYSQKTANWMREDVLYDVRNVSKRLTVSESYSDGR